LLLDDLIATYSGSITDVTDLTDRFRLGIIQHFTELVMRLASEFSMKLSVKAKYP